MAGTIVANTINTDTGAYLTANALTGVAKAWVNFGYVSSALTTRASYNVSSVTRVSTGIYTINFPAGVMADANYVFAGSAESLSGNVTSQIYASGGVGTAPTLKTTTQCQINFSAGGSLSDIYTASAIFLGN